MKQTAVTWLICLAAVVLPAFAQPPRDVAIARASLTARSTGNFLLEQILLRRLGLEYNGDLSDAASHRLAENALARGDYAETIRLLNLGDGTGDESSPQIRRDRALIGEAFRRSGDAGSATAGLNAVFASTPDPIHPDDASILAVRSLDSITTDVDEHEHFRRAGLYQFNRYWDEARQHYRQVTGSPDAAEVLFQIGRGYAQEGKYDDAVVYFQQVLDNYSETQEARDSILQIASAYSRNGEDEEAIHRYQSFIDKYPADEKAPRAYLNIVDIYRDLGDDAHALEWCHRTEAAFQGRTPEALAIFDEAKILATQGEWRYQMQTIDRLIGRKDLGGASVPGGTTAAELACMRAYASKMLDETGSMALYLSACRPDPLKQVQGSDLGTRYADILVRRASAKSLDPRLLLALMRQESNFDPTARSSAAARGLMQFTHPQAVKIATELGWTHFDDEELYSPEVSITLAVRYLADLSAMFPGQTEAVIASYNGGEGNVKRWMVRAKSDEPERYVPEIVYGQTKDYVERVMGNYRFYCRLYDEQLKPK